MAKVIVGRVAAKASSVEFTMTHGPHRLGHYSAEGVSLENQKIGGRGAVEKTQICYQQHAAALQARHIDHDGCSEEQNRSSRSVALGRKFFLVRMISENFDDVVSQSTARLRRLVGFSEASL